jgi:monoamine oxidase
MPKPARLRRKVRVIVAGAGLAGLTAARHLERAGAEVTVVEARSRVGGRVYTLRDGFAAAQHVEAGADLIEAEQTQLLALAKELDLEIVRILRSGWGFYGGRTARALTLERAPDTFEQAAKLLAREIDAYNAAGRRWDSAVAEWLARQSAADWLQRVKADATLRAAICGLRGFYLANPEDLSLLVLVDQFAESAIPGASKMYRLQGGNDTLPRAIASRLRGRVLLDTVVRRVSQTGRGVRMMVDDGRRHELTADYLVLALPATMLRQVDFEPALPEDQWRAIATLRYGAATRVVLQFEKRFWKKLGRPIAFGSDRPTGAVWDGNEQQTRSPGILTLLAGGGASRALRDIVRRDGWTGVVRRLSWLGRPAKLLTARAYVWDTDRWSRGGYAVFDPSYDPALRAWLARPAGRLVFAGEHTSERFQGFMNGAVESGRRAAIEVAVMAGLNYSA